MAPSARFWDKIAERYSKQTIKDEAAYQKKHQVTRGYFRPEMEILEFGCGTGSTAILHAPYVKHILATDISSKMIEIAQRKAGAQNIQNVTFKCVAIDEFSAPDNTFDAVLGHSILHLVENKEDIIVKVHEMLKPGGVFVSSTACIGDMMMFFKIIAPIGRFFGFLPLVAVFKAKELVASLNHAGFVIEHQWRPGKNKAVFIVAKKAENEKK